MYLVILGLVLIAVMIFGNVSFASDEGTNILSPMKQIKSGIQVQDVKCKSGYSLVIKSSNDYPYCVKSHNVARFLAHGWVTPDKFVTTFQPVNHDKIKGTVTSEHTYTISNTDSNLTESVPINHQNETNPTESNNSSTSHSMESIPAPNQNDSTTTVSNNTLYPPYPVPPEQIYLVRTINASSLPPITEIPPRPAVSTTPLPPINEPTIVNYSNPNITKILAVGMSPDSLKVGDVPQFTVTYQNISDKPIYGMTGCSGNPDLQSVITPPAKVEKFHYSFCQRPNFGDIIQPNQIVTEMPELVYVYKIIQSGPIEVTITLDLSDNSTEYSHNINTIQFNVNATQ